MFHEIFHELYAMTRPHELLHFLSGFAGTFVGVGSYIVLFERRRKSRPPYQQAEDLSLPAEMRKRA